MILSKTPSNKGVSRGEAGTSTISFDLQFVLPKSRFTHFIILILLKLLNSHQVNISSLYYYTIFTKSGFVCFLSCLIFDVCTAAHNNMFSIQWLLHKGVDIYKSRKWFLFPPEFFPLYLDKLDHCLHWPQACQAINTMLASQLSAGQAAGLMKGWICEEM